jgi:hypothetical protein
VPKLEEQIVHCGHAIKHFETFNLPAEDVKIQGCKFVELAIGNCKQCKKQVMAYRKLDESGLPQSSAWLQIQRKEQEDWLKIVGILGQIFIASGALYVSGSNPEHPYNMRRVPVK